MEVEGNQTTIDGRTTGGTDRQTYPISKSRSAKKSSPIHWNDP